MQTLNALDLGKIWLKIAVISLSYQLRISLFPIQFPFVVEEIILADQQGICASGTFLRQQSSCNAKPIIRLTFWNNVVVATLFKSGYIFRIANNYDAIRW